MDVTVLHTGPFGVNTLLVPLGGGQVFVVDPASCAFCDDETVVSSYLAQHHLEPVALVLTHGHFDHVAGLPFLVHAYPNIPLVIHRDDAEMIGADSAVVQGSMLARMGFTDFVPSVSNLPEPTGFLEDGRTLADCVGCAAAALADWTVLHTPGHSKGSCCLYNAAEKLLVSGDTLFYRSWGRTDLYGGSESQIRESLRRLARTVEKDARVYPGHDCYGFAFGDC